MACHRKRQPRCLQYLPKSHWSNMANTRAQKDIWCHLPRFLPTKQPSQHVRRIQPYIDHIHRKILLPIHVSLGATPNVRFKNLRMLQIRKELNLIQSILISLDHFTHMGGEIVAKIRALEQVVGSEIMNWYKVPPKKKLIIMS